MPSSALLNRYALLRDLEEVQAEMDELPQTLQDSPSRWKDEAVASDPSLPPPVRLETMPPPRRGINWPIFSMKKQVEQYEKQQRERLSLVDVSAVLISMFSTRQSRFNRMTRNSSL